MKQTRRVLILTLVLFFIGISSVWAGAISFTDPDGNYWQTSTVGTGGSMTATGTDIQAVLADLADNGSIDGTYNILGGVTGSPVTSGTASTVVSAPDAGVAGTFSLMTSLFSIDGNTNTNGESFVLPATAGGGNIYYSFTAGDASGEYDLDVVFLQGNDTDGYLYAGLGIENITSYTMISHDTNGGSITTTGTPPVSLSTVAFTLLNDPDASFSFDIAGNSNIDVIYGKTCSSVPVPGAIWLMGSGLFGLIGIRRRKNRSQA